MLSEIYPPTDAVRFYEVYFVEELQYHHGDRLLPTVQKELKEQLANKIAHERSIRAELFPKHPLLPTEKGVFIRLLIETGRVVYEPDGVLPKSIGIAINIQGQELVFQCVNSTSILAGLRDMLKREDDPRRPYFRAIHDQLLPTTSRYQ